MKILYLLIFLNPLWIFSQSDSCEIKMSILQKELDSLRANPKTIHYILIKEMPTGVERLEVLDLSEIREFKISNNILWVATAKVLNNIYIIDLLGNLRYQEVLDGVQEYKKDLDFLESGVYLFLYIDSKNIVHYKKIKITK